jgi:hypothetical protein
MSKKSKKFINQIEEKLVKAMCYSEDSKQRIEITENFSLLE